MPDVGVISLAASPLIFQPNSLHSDPQLYYTKHTFLMKFVDNFIKVFEMIALRVPDVGLEPTTIRLKV